MGHAKHDLAQVHASLKPKAEKRTDLDKWRIVSLSAWYGYNPQNLGPSKPVVATKKNTPKLEAVRFETLQPSSSDGSGRSKTKTPHWLEKIPVL